MEELNKLNSQATRQKVKDLLSIEVRKLETEIIKLKDQSNETDTVQKSSTILPQNRCYNVKLSNYGMYLTK